MENNIIAELDEQHINELLVYTSGYSEKNAENIKKMFMQKTAKKHVPGKRVLLAAAIAAALIALSGIALAVSSLLTPSDVMDNIGFHELGVVFDGEDAIDINTSRSVGGYTITLMSIASGNDIEDDWLNAAGGGVSGDGIYVLIAIEKMDDSPALEFDDFDSFHVSPFIGGLQPSLVSSKNFVRFGAIHVIDGVKYILVECGELSVFADRGVYIGVNSGITRDYRAFVLNDETGQIIPNPEFEGINVIFRLPFAISLADPEKAQLLLNES